VTAYVLTRTARRPRMFQRLRDSLLSQEFDGRILHVVLAETGSDYAEGDHVMHRPPRAREAGRCPYNLHIHDLLTHVAGLEPGWVTFMDDDDQYTSDQSLARMLEPATHPGVMPVWKVQRENGRISPAKWRASPASKEGRICFEGAAHHTTLIGRGPLSTDCWADAHYWQGIHRHAEIAWIDAVLTRPQLDGRAGKGHGRKRDA
jgi:hypothetical protein